MRRTAPKAAPNSTTTVSNQRVGPWLVSCSFSLRYYWETHWFEWTSRGRRTRGQEELLNLNLENDCTFVVMKIVEE